MRWPRADANIPLAAGYIAAHASACAPGWEVELLPWEEADVYGDSLLLASILRRKPLVAGFSLYLWNSERSARLAKKLREHGVFTVGGGPEADPSNSWLYESGGFDLLIPGEGEAAFSALLNSFPALPAGQPPALLDLTKAKSPYLEGFLRPAHDNSAWLETVRGCPFCCDYCNYGKRFKTVRTFREGWLSDHLRWFRENGVSEVYLMDPSFNVRPDWEKTLSDLEEGNAGGGLSFHTELSAQHLRPGDAGRLARAGLVSAEVGLQSVRPKVLKNVGRTFDRKKWLARMRELTSEGIAASVGLIVGLPGDDLEGFSESLDFVLANLPEADIQLFPLALLPGTALRERAEEEGIHHFLLPPYTVFSTPTMNAEEIHKAFLLFEEATGHELDPLGNPSLTGPFTGGENAVCLTGARLNAAGSLSPEWPENLAKRAGANFTFLISGWREGLAEELGRFAGILPHTALTVVLEDADKKTPERVKELRKAVAPEPYLRRHYSHLSTDLFPRIVVLLDHKKAGSGFAEELRKSAELILTVSADEGWRGRTVELALAGETLFVTGETKETDFSALVEELGEDAGGVFFQSARAQEKFSAVTAPGTVFMEENRITLG